MSIQGDLVYIDKFKLKVPVEYQRDYNPLKSRKIRLNWSWEACGSLTVMDRDGELFIVDGQHRYRAALTMESIKTLPCSVFKSGGVKDEAMLFVQCNNSRAFVSAIEKHKAMCVADDDLAKFVAATLDNARLTIKKAATKPGEITSVAWLMACAKSDRSVFVKVVNLAAETSAKQHVTVNMLYGIEWLIKKGLDVEDKRVRSVFIARGSERLNIAMKKMILALGHTGGNICGPAMLQELNHGLKSKLIVAGVNSK